jgi:hypothetical protein
MLDRSRLHELIDTLPEAAIALAQGSLEHLQTWPPQEPPQAREFREHQLERMRGLIRPGTGGGGGGGGSYRMGPGGRREYGHQSYSYWEDDAVVVVTHRFHAGHELLIEERLRLVDGTRLTYSHKITGPDGTTDRREVAFSVESK